MLSVNGVYPLNIEPVSRVNSLMTLSVAQGVNELDVNFITVSINRDP